MADQEFTESDLPENVAVNKILNVLMGMDGMNNCMALGILECVKQVIFHNMQNKQNDDESLDT